MKKLLLLLFCFAVKTCFAQIVVDKNVAKAYNKTVNQLQPDYQQLVLGKTKDKDLFSGFSIFTIYNIDTLNKHDKIKRNIVHVFDLNTDRTTGKVTQREVMMNDKNENIYMPLPYMALLKGDTLFLQIASPFFPRHIYTIVKGKVVSIYQEYQKHDNIFRLNLSQLKSKEISIPVKTREFKLSTLNFKPGQVIYGEIEFVTDPYYVDDLSFTTGCIKKRLHGKFVFKTTIAAKVKP